MPTEFMAPAVIEDLLSPFCMFDTDGYNPGSSPDINNPLVWTTKARSIPSVIIVHVEPTFCETIVHPKGDVELTAMSGKGITVQINGVVMVEDFNLVRI
jgi:hypothetical protein